VNIGPIDISGAMPDALFKVAASAKNAEASQAVQSKDNDAEVSPSQLKKMIVEMQGQLDDMNSSLQYCFYGVHDEKVAVRVVNRETGDVIREIPPKEIQALQTKMSELCGMIFDEKG
jgi:flagellar protein FlaG